ncbi:flagellar biosynthesis anti-sigma factor FlgM [Tengunoibacter tsumagoiensis]|uniref:Uncharacterized protein n=1 Tax=Tengunoibacter tsumagoiensis TaxID=2014871 RepID=A0A402A3M6_9CHLR|nr:flagellar biosynthesis anti-sigma factor FlgM [Tengunoibacter tsumagoiensis]GCE13744.1 hypothetical protein KTT_36030 [Tengunoibacter tsumagoiensis]
MMKIQKIERQRQMIQTPQQPSLEQSVEAVPNEAPLNAQILARTDSAERIARIELLKQQVEAGAYLIDSQTLAQTLQASWNAHDLLGIGDRDLLTEAGSEEPS